MQFLLLACLSLGLDVLTVDDDGPADFPDILSAVAASQPGDVIVVAGGVYLGFDVPHALAIVAGEPADLPRVTDQVRVDGVAHVTLDGLRLQRLESTGASALVVRRGGIGDWADPGLNGALQIEGGSAILSQVIVRGSTSGNWNPAPPCSIVTSSQVVLSGCDVFGAKGFSPDYLYGNGGDGGVGLQVDEGSHVWLVSTSVHGGYVGWGTTPFSPHDGDGGNGIEISDSVLVASGSQANEIASGGWEPIFQGGPGHSLILDDSAVRTSGVTIGQKLGPVLDANSSLIIPSVPDPYVVAESGAPGSTDGVLHFVGPAGATLLAGIGKVEQPVVLLHEVSALWIQPDAMDTLMFPVTTLGRDTP